MLRLYACNSSLGSLSAVSSKQSDPGSKKRPVKLVESCIRRRKKPIKDQRPQQVLKVCPLIGSYVLVSYQSSLLYPLPPHLALQANTSDSPQIWENCYQQTRPNYWLESHEIKCISSTKGLSFALVLFLLSQVFFLIPPPSPLPRVANFGFLIPRWPLIPVQNQSSDRNRDSCTSITEFLFLNQLPGFIWCCILISWCIIVLLTHP